MSITKAQTNKLLTNLTGKQAFIVVTQAFVERSLNHSYSFTDPEIERIMDAIWNNPQRSLEFRRYREAKDVMDVAMYEGKLAIQKTITHILLQIMITSQIAHDRKPHEKVIEWAEEHTEILQNHHALIIHWLEWAQRWQIILQAFDAVLSTHMQDMLNYDMGKLEMFTKLYHDRMGWIEHDITYAYINAAEQAKASPDVIDKLSAKYVASDEKWQLPPLAIATDNPMLQHCITYLHQCPDKPFYKVLDVIEGA
jgi:hypothetical protein